jgi:predicted dehydrogenase
MDRPAELSVIRQLRDDGLDGFNQVLVGPAHPYIRGRPADGLPRRFVRTGDLFGYQARAFLEQVAGIEGLPAVATFEDGLRDLAVVDAVTRSAAAGGASVDIAN